MTAPDPTLDPCLELRLLVQADFDGELDAAAAARVAAHVGACPACAAFQRDLTALSARLRAELPPPQAPARLVARYAAPTAPVVPLRRRTRLAGAFAAGTLTAGAIAAALVLLLPGPAMPGLDAELVASHIRALQPGHLTDVVSSDRHTVKPWFDGRIDYAPPVPDFAAAGFPLVGGRLDYVGGRAVAVLVYRHARHDIDVYVWPEHAAAAPTVSVRQGYNIVTWAAGDMTLRAVSDLEADELRAFARLWTQP